CAIGGPGSSTVEIACGVCGFAKASALATTTSAAAARMPLVVRDLRSISASVPIQTHERAARIYWSCYAARHVRRPLSLLAAALIGLCFAGLPARAQVLPPFDIHARYEEELIADTLKDEGLTPDPSPLGKTIERIVIAPHPVFLPNFDPVPAWFNI